MKKFILIIVFFIAHYSLFINHCLSQWQPDVRLTNDPFVSQTSLNYAWCIAASGDTVHVNWFDERNGLTQVYYKRSTDKGITWGSDTRLTTSSTWAERGGIAVNGPVVHIVWQDWRNPSWEIYYRRSIDGGNTWGPETRLTYADGNSWAPTVYVSGSLVHVFWVDTRDGHAQVYYKRSTDGGISWGADIRLTNNPAESWYPVCTQSGSNVHLVWSDARNGTNQVYYKRSTDNGLNWGIDTRVTNTTTVSQNPTIVVNGSIVHIAWWDNRDGNYEIYYNRSTNAGLSWGVDTRLTNAPDISSTPSLACSGSNLLLTWEDLRDGNYEIYYKQSTNEGLNWTNDIRLTNSTGTSLYASVCLSAQCAHVVWFDERDGNREIYYKRNLLAPSTPILLSPSNGSTGVSITSSFFWNTVSEVTGYKIQISTDSTFATLTDSSTVITNQYITPPGKLSQGTKYFWRVTGFNSFGTGQWSSAWNFTTIQNLPVSLKVYLEGYWNGTTQIPDTAKIYLANPSSPFAIVDSAIVILSTSGTASLTFSKVVNGNYFIVVKHRNHIETWSKYAQSFVSGVTVNYDFTTAKNQAFGNNLKQEGPVWVIYSGDVNQDRLVDALDMIAIDNDVANFVTGNVVTDLIGDGVVDALDMIICDNNVANFIEAIVPPGAMTVKIPRTYEQMKAIEKYVKDRVEQKQINDKLKKENSAKPVRNKKDK